MGRKIFTLHKDFEKNYFNYKTSQDYLFRRQSVKYHIFTHFLKS